MQTLNIDLQTKIVKLRLESLKQQMSEHIIKQKTTLMGLIVVHINMSYAAVKASDILLHITYPFLENHNKKVALTKPKNNCREPSQLPVMA